MKTIELTQGQVTFVADEDYERVMSVGKWFAQKHKDGFYAIHAGRSVRGVREPHIQMHRFIMDAPDGLEVDHEDGNGLNNQRSNLRLATRAQNQHNKVKSQNKSSEFKGVSWHKQKQKWRAQIAVDGKRLHLGMFVDPEEAAREYDRAALKYHGEFAKTNTMLGLFDTPHLVVAA